MVTPLSAPPQRDLKPVPCRCPAPTPADGAQCPPSRRRTTPGAPTTSASAQT
jgi:hypothetical protein